jgi:hypothetical protein
MRKPILALLIVVVTAVSACAGSYYTVRPNDSSAVYVTSESFGVHGDGISDDGAAIQRAIDKVQETRREGIVFLPPGRYALTTTVNIWPGIRLIGYGATRPVLVLRANTPGYQDKNHENYMVFFAGYRPGSRGEAVQSQVPPPDANPGTFYSALSNVDLEIEEGNPGAVGIRGTYAQHSFLAHMDFRLRSGIAAVHDTGNVMEDVKFFGGQYGLWTRKPSPGWQLTAVDVEFEGQTEAAIRETEAGLTLIRPHFRRVPTAITIDDGYPDELWLKDAVLEEVSGPAFVISLERNPRTEINMENVVCRNVSTFALLRESSKRLSSTSGIYRLPAFSHGLTFADIGAPSQIKTVFAPVPLQQMPPPVVSDLPPLPAGDTWANIRELGAKGDGVTDDTAAIRAAIEKHKAIYFPSGHYVVSDTIALKPDTVLIGLHPSTTRFVLPDKTPAFQGVGSAKAMIEAPKGGANIVIGLGVYTNGINPRATAVKWMAGKDSLMNDVRFLGGHGTRNLDGTSEAIYNNNHTADPNLSRRWDSQYPSLWVTDGGGGTFFDIWTPSTFAQAGMLVSNTTTEGRVYQLSSEHHVRYEVQLRNAANWHIYALQTEEERGEGGFALPLEIDNSSNITVANLHMYRVISSYQPFPWAVKVSRSHSIRFRNIHSFSNSKVSFDTTIYDQTRNRELRQREFAWLNLDSQKVAPTASAAGSITKLATGFFNASGGAVAPNGDFYFVDAKWQRIYRWDVSRNQLAAVRDAVLDPVNLAFDKAGNLIVVSYSGNGTVYSFNPNSPSDEITIIESELAAPRPGLTPVLPTGDWELQRHRSGHPTPRSRHFLSPDKKVYISATEGFATGQTSWGVKSADLIRSFSLTPAAPGKPFYITSESEITTWKAQVAPDGSLSDLTVFANQGGEGVTTDAQGNVYIVSGQVYVYRPDGTLIETIEVPERPTQAVFGGKDGRTLFILTRSSLYQVRR